MNCRRAADCMDAALDLAAGGAPAHLDPQVEAHFHACTACRRQWQVLVAAETALRAPRPVPAPADMLAEFQRRVRLEEAAPKADPGSSPWRWLWPTGAVAGAALAGFLVLNTQMALLPPAREVARTMSAGTAAPPASRAPETPPAPGGGRPALDAVTPPSLERRHSEATTAPAPGDGLASSSAPTADSAPAPLSGTSPGSSTPPSGGSLSPPRVGGEGLHRHGTPESAPPRPAGSPHALHETPDRETVRNSYRAPAARPRALQAAPRGRMAAESGLPPPPEVRVPELATSAAAGAGATSAPAPRATGGAGSAAFSVPPPPAPEPAVRGSVSVTAPPARKPASSNAEVDRTAESQLAAKQADHLPRRNQDAVSFRGSPPASRLTSAGVSGPVLASLRTPVALALDNVAAPLALAQLSEAVGLKVDVVGEVVLPVTLPGGPRPGWQALQEIARQTQCVIYPAETGVVLRAMEAQVAPLGRASAGPSGPAAGLGGAGGGSQGVGSGSPGGFGAGGNASQMQSRGPTVPAGASEPRSNQAPGRSAPSPAAVTAPRDLRRMEVQQDVGALRQNARPADAAAPGRSAPTQSERRMEPLHAAPSTNRARSVPQNAPLPDPRIWASSWGPALRSGFSEPAAASVAAPQIRTPSGRGTRRGR